MMGGPEGMNFSHVIVMAIVTNTCALHLVDITNLFLVLAHLQPGIDVVNSLHLVVGIVLYMVNIVETLAMAIVRMAMTGEVGAEAEAAAMGIASEVRIIVVEV